MLLTHYLTKINQDLVFFNENCFLLTENIVQEAVGQGGRKGTFFSEQVDEMIKMPFM